MISRFTVRAGPTIGGVIEVTVGGEIDPETSDMLFGALIAALSVDDVRHVAVDLAHVTFLDASGIGVLLAAQNRALAAGKMLRVCAVAALPLRVLEITGVLDRLYAKAVAPTWRLI
jgi:stage II sporulation protein AA (anti-sigma F factor antagonist)